MKPLWGFRAELKARTAVRDKSHFLRQVNERVCTLSFTYYEETWDLNGQKAKTSRILFPARLIYLLGFYLRAMTALACSSIWAAVRPKRCWR